MGVSYFTDEVPGPIGKGCRSGRSGFGGVSLGTRAVAGLDLPLGGDLKARGGLAGPSGLAVFAEGMLRPERTMARHGLPAGHVIASHSCLSGRLRVQDGQAIVTRMLDQAAGPVAMLQRPHWPCSDRWPGTVPLPPSVPSSAGAQYSQSGSRCSNAATATQHIRAITAPLLGAQQLRPGAGAAELSPLVRRGMAQWERCRPPRSLCGLLWSHAAGHGVPGGASMAGDSATFC